LILISFISNPDGTPLLTSGSATHSTGY